MAASLESGSHFFDTKIQTGKPSVQGAMNLHMRDDEECTRWNTVSILKRQLESEIGFTIGTQVDTFSINKATLLMVLKRICIVLYPWTYLHFFFESYASTRETITYRS